MDLGAQMREIRTELGLTCIEVSERAGVNPANVSMIETGRRGGSVTSINRILAVYGCKLAIAALALEERRE